MKKFLGLLLLLGLAAYFVWPTRYQEYAAGTGPYAQQIGHRTSRVDRLTGTVFVIGTKGEWVATVVESAPLRPDVIPPPPPRGINSTVIQQQTDIQKQMQEKTKEMVDEAVKKAKGEQ